MIITASDVEIVEAAAAEIDGHAAEIRLSSTISDAVTMWPDPADKAVYDKMRAQVADLYALAERLRAEVRT